MFESSNTQPRILQEHHRLVGAGSSKTMFASPITQPRLLQQHHLRVQERPATIAPKASTITLANKSRYSFLI